MQAYEDVEELYTKSLYNRNAFYVGSGKAGLSGFISLGLLNVTLPVALSLSGPPITLSLKGEFPWCCEAAGTRPGWSHSSRRTICGLWPVPVS